MKPTHFISFFVALLAGCWLSQAQPITLYEQFNGRYEHIAIGNTMNYGENNAQPSGHPNHCQVMTQSSAPLSLLPSQTVEAAYLYWSGSGTAASNTTVELNGQTIVADRTFEYTGVLSGNSLTFFGCVADVTAQVQTAGNAVYTVSDLDVNPTITSISGYCTISVDYAGWALMVVYEDPALPLNQINLYEGFEAVHQNSNQVSVVLDNILIAGTNGSTISLLAWEGDSGLSINETLQVNSNVLSNPPLNPATNLFNSTNSFTGSNQLYNMDLDYFDIQNYISVGDTEIDILLTSGDPGVGGDFILLNYLITTVNSQLPDATIELDDLDGNTLCGNRDLEVDYTVYNVNSTDILPAPTPIAFYADGQLVGTAATLNDIPIGGSESQSITLSIPPEVPALFELVLSVDDTGDGTGIVNELNEDNNQFTMMVQLYVYPTVPVLPDLTACQTIETVTFDLTEATAGVSPDYDISYHTGQTDAENGDNAITDYTDYANTVNPQTIYVRVDNGHCHVITTFEVEVLSCPLPDATISIDNDLFPCRLRALDVAYTVYNLSPEATGPLPAQTPIAFYADNQLVATAATEVEIPVDGQWSSTISFFLPTSIPDAFILTARVDDTGDGTGVVEEWDEDNNTFEEPGVFATIPELTDLPGLLECNEGFGLATFDLTELAEYIDSENEGEIYYYTSYEDALSEQFPIENPAAYHSTSKPQTIYVRLDTQVCFTIGQFEITTEDCPVWIPQGFSPNGDGINDFFQISGLLDIYLNHELKIYSRHGTLIFVGNNLTRFWDGSANTGLLYEGPVPVGVYYYVLYLNNEDRDTYTGWVYLNK